MSLNIFPRKREAAEAAPSQPTEQILPEPSAEALAEPARRVRAPRAAAASPRAPRGRRAAEAVTETATPDAAEPAIATATTVESEAAPAPRSRARAPRRVTPATAAADLTEAAVMAEPVAEMEAPREESGDTNEGESDDGSAATGEGRGRRRRGGRGRGRRNEATTEAEGAEADPTDEPGDDSGGDEASAQPRGETRGRERGDRNRERTPRPEPVARTESDPASIARSIDAQGRQLADLGKQVERLVRTTEDLVRRPGGGGGPAAPVVRVGVFVDTANIELACDRLRVRFDWGKVLRLVTNERQLVRAMAYSPIHDDLSVSIETQRFVEPFLDKGFKVVTKPFRRFQDGSIKANLDIELALDVVTMLDRLDVVVLISGDGDFQRLVELAQGRGVRVEVAAVGSSTATNLKHAADSFIDLGARARDLRS